MRAVVMVLTMVLASCASPPETPEIQFLRQVERFARTPMSEMRQAVEAWLGMPLETDEFRARNARRVVDTPAFAGRVSVSTDFPPPAAPGAGYAIGSLIFENEPPLRSLRPCITPDAVRAVFGGRGRLVTLPNLLPRAYEVEEGGLGYLVSVEPEKRAIVFAFSGYRCAGQISISEGNTSSANWVIQVLAERGAE